MDNLYFSQKQWIEVQHIFFYRRGWTLCVKAYCSSPKNDNSGIFNFDSSVGWNTKDVLINVIFFTQLQYMEIRALKLQKDQFIKKNLKSNRKIDSE